PSSSSLFYHQCRVSTEKQNNGNKMYHGSREKKTVNKKREALRQNECAYRLVASCFGWSRGFPAYQRRKRGKEKIFRQHDFPAGQKLPGKPDPVPAFLE